MRLFRDPERVSDAVPETVLDGPQGEVFAGEVEDCLTAGVDGLDAEGDGKVTVAGVDGQEVGGRETKGDDTSKDRGRVAQGLSCANGVDGELVELRDLLPLLSSRGVDGKDTGGGALL